MPSPYAIYPYEGSTFLDLVCRFPETSLKQVTTNKTRHIRAKTHIAYFESYFKDMGAKTIVVEKEYIDRDFLDDFAGYYVRCFTDYGRICSRFHFFRDSFGEPEIERLFELPLPTDSIELIKDSYLGFIVIKPLPETVIGRTCLKPYPCDERRYFPITRNYEANFLGLKLEVRTLAFQEQDKTVSACATSALWSVLQGTGVLFHHKMVSPIEITTASVSRYPIESRAIPNNGLTAEQMADAVRSVGLEPFVIDATDELVLKSTLYGYLTGGIPILMGISLVDDCNGELLGLHAIAVTGYSLGSAYMAADSSEIQLLATRMDKLYAHDDQVGPFCRMVFENNNEPQISCLSTSFPCLHGRNDSVRGEPQFIMIPLYNKIRIPYETVHEAIRDFDRYLREIGQDYFERLQWEIFLTTINKFKSSIFNDSDDRCGRPINRKQILAQRLPRFLWRARAYSSKGPAFDLLFDATDIEQGNIFLKTVEYDEQLMRFLCPFIKALAKREDQLKPLASILQSFC